MDDVEALMGFSAFGGGAASKRSKRRKSQQQHAAPRAAAAVSRWPPAQVVPGTELSAQLTRCNAKRLEHGAHGVTYLLSGLPRGDDGQESGADALAALLRDPVAGAGDSRFSRGAATARLLPARSYELLDELQQVKNRFDVLDGATFRRARSAANAFEALGRGRFLNRSAMKLVNMDHIFRWTAATPAGVSSDSSAFTFADVCGGPGGFSEYLLWRLSTPSTAASRARRVVRGYGISLKHEVCDWKLPPLSDPGSDDSEAPAHASDDVSFEISYGADGTGDLYRIDNVRHFRDHVVLKSHPSGVDLVVADGGFQDARDQRDQEQVMARLVVAEALTMFSVLSARGSFVCKTFELATPLMLQLVWLLHQCFEKIAVVKPVTSRPASSERYIVAINRRERLPTDAIVRALEARLESPEGRMDLLFDTSVVSPDADFLAFMAAASDRLALAQIDACQRILDAANEAGSKRKRRSSDERVDPALYLKCWGLEAAS